LLSLDGFVQLELSAPEILIPEGVKAEDLLALRDQVGRLSGLCLCAGNSKQDQRQEKDS
jgi:hypothetical protein